MNNYFYAKHDFTDKFMFKKTKTYSFTDTRIVGGGGGAFANQWSINNPGRQFKLNSIMLNQNWRVPGGAGPQYNIYTQAKYFTMLYPILGGATLSFSNFSSLPQGSGGWEIWFPGKYEFENMFYTDVLTMSFSLQNTDISAITCDFNIIAVTEDIEPD